MTRWRQKVCVTAVALCAACGDRAVSFPPIEPDKPLADLTTGEKQAICEAGVENLKAIASDDALCRVGVAIAADRYGPELCDAGYDICRRELAKRDLWRNVDCNMDANDTSCQATTGELQACFDDAFNLLDGMLSGVPCPTSEAAFKRRLPVEAPASCDELAKKCPRVTGAWGAEIDPDDLDFN